MDNSSSKKLYRSRKNRIIGGVLGGLGEYLQVDVVLLRIIYLLLMFFGNFPFFTILYIIGWVIIPEQPKISATLDGTSVEGYVEDAYSQYASSTAEEPGAEQHVSGKVVLGAILLVVGAVILFKPLRLSFKLVKHHLFEEFGRYHYRQITLQLPQTAGRPGAQPANGAAIVIVG